MALLTTRCGDINPVSFATKIILGRYPWHVHPKKEKKKKKTKNGNKKIKQKGKERKEPIKLPGIPVANYCYVYLIGREEARRPCPGTRAKVVRGCHTPFRLGDKRGTLRPRRRRLR